MTRPHLFFAFFLFTFALGGTAAADAAPRAGRLMSLTGERPGVWVSNDRIWSSGAESFLSACAPGRGCAPVSEQQNCTAPECPGSGTVYRVSHDVASVDGWPTDHDGFHRELDLLRADEALNALGYSNHPDHGEWQQRHNEDEANRRNDESRRSEDVRWVNSYREDGERLELGLSGSLATLTETGGTYMGGTASLGLVYLLDASMARDEDDDFIPNFFFGDTIGAELRAHFLYRADSAQEAEWITAIGVSPVLENRFEDSVVRIPTYIGSILPEVGLMLRADRDPTWYVAWDIPFSFLIDHDFAFDVTARFFVVDEWIELPDDAPEDADDPAEIIMMLNLGFRLP